MAPSTKTITVIPPFEVDAELRAEAERLTKQLQEMLPRLTKTARRATEVRLRLEKEISGAAAGVTPYIEANFPAGAHDRAQDLTDDLYLLYEIASGVVPLRAAGEAIAAAFGAVVGDHVVSDPEWLTEIDGMRAQSGEGNAA